VSYGFSRDQWYNYIADRSHPPVASAVVEKPEYDPDHVYAWKPANNYKGWKLIARGEAGVDDAEVPLAIQKAIYSTPQGTIIIRNVSITKLVRLENIQNNTIIFDNVELVPTEHPNDDWTSTKSRFAVLFKNVNNITVKGNIKLRHTTNEGMNGGFLCIKCHNMRFNIDAIMDAPPDESVPYCTLLRLLSESSSPTDFENKDIYVENCNVRCFREDYTAHGAFVYAYCVKNLVVKNNFVMLNEDFVHMDLPSSDVTIENNIVCGSAFVDIILRPFTKTIKNIIIRGNKFIRVNEGSEHVTNLPSNIHIWPIEDGAVLENLVIEGNYFEGDDVWAPYEAIALLQYNNSIGMHIKNTVIRNNIINLVKAVPDKDNYGIYIVLDGTSKIDKLIIDNVYIRIPNTTSGTRYGIRIDTYSDSSIDEVILGEHIITDVDTKYVGNVKPKSSIIGVVSDVSELPTGYYIGQTVACYDPNAGKWILKVYDGSEWQTIG